MIIEDFQCSVCKRNNKYFDYQNKGSEKVQTNMRQLGKEFKTKTKNVFFS